MNCGGAAQIIFGNNSNLKHWCFTVNPLIPLESTGLLSLTSLCQNLTTHNFLQWITQGYSPSYVLWRGSSRSGTRDAGQLHLQIPYWERWFSASEEKKPNLLVSVTMIETTQGSWVGIKYIYICTHLHIFICIYVQPIFLIYIQNSPIFLCICTHANKTEGIHVKQNSNDLIYLWELTENRNKKKKPH